MSADIVELIEAFEATLRFDLDPFQREAIAKLESHTGLLVSAPTSSGKTVVAEYAVWRCLDAPAHLRQSPDRPARVIYTTPLKALSNQKYRDLRGRHGEHAVGLVTGEHTVNDDAPIVVMTTEILRNVIYDDPARLDLVGDVILDEVHYIDDYPRGTVWEEVIISAPPHVRLTGLSATISNVDEVAAWMSELRGTVATVVRTERPVALEMWLALDNHLHPLLDNGSICRATLDLAQNAEIHESRFRYSRRAPDNDLLDIVASLGRQSMLPAIYFIFSRRGCREALGRVAVHGIDLTTAAEKRRIDDIYRQRSESIDDPDERDVFRESISPDLLARGLAMHHAGMLPYAKETVEELFQHGLIKVVFATETLSLGLNMPARACVISSFTKFDGTGFHALTSGELTQLLGRAGRRGIDTVGHGVILKEHDVDIRDICDAAVGGEMSVSSKFAPTYTMILNLLRTRSSAEVENLLQLSFGQFQTLRQVSQWSTKQANLQSRLEDLRERHYRHPRVDCTERTLSTHLRLTHDIETTRATLRRARRDHWRDSRSGRFGGRAADPGQRYEGMRRTLKTLTSRIQQSPCSHCPYLSDHRGQRLAILDIESTLEGGEAELERARNRYRRDFRALRGVLRDAGFLDGDSPTDLGVLAASLFGESALVVADAIAGDRFSHLTEPELAASLVMLVAEDRGRDRAAQHRGFPTPRVERTWLDLRATVQRLASLERHHGVATIRPLSTDYIDSAYRWASGVALADIDPPAGADLGDVVKAIKNLYSMLRQMELALRGLPLGNLLSATREAIERDLIRRI